MRSQNHVFGTLVKKISDLRWVSTRKIQKIVKSSGIGHLSPASVSRRAKDFDDQVQVFLLRKLNDQPVLYVDAPYYKVRSEARYITKGIQVVAGVRKDEYREIPGVKVTDCENEVLWSLLFGDLKERGATGIQRVISDDHTGIQKPASTAFLSASWQMCSIHCTRATLRNIPRKTPERGGRGPKRGLGDEQNL